MLIICLFVKNYLSVDCITFHIFSHNAIHKHIQYTYFATCNKNLRKYKMLHVPKSHVFLACLNGAFASISGSIDSFRLGVLDKGSNWIFSLLSFPGLPFGILLPLFYFPFYSGRPFIRQSRSYARKELSSCFPSRFVYRVTCFEFSADWRLANYHLSYTRKINAIDLLPSLNVPVSRWYRSFFSYTGRNVHVENYIELFS